MPHQLKLELRAPMQQECAIEGFERRAAAFLCNPLKSR